MTQLPAVLTADEVAEILRVHPNTVRKWAAEGRIKAVGMPGRALRFRREDIDRLIGIEAATA